MTNRPLKFKKIEIISSIFSDHNDRKLEINYQKNKRKQTKATTAEKHIQRHGG